MDEAHGSHSRSASEGGPPGEGSIVTRVSGSGRKMSAQYASLRRASRQGSGTIPPVLLQHHHRSNSLNDLLLLQERGGAPAATDAFARKDGLGTFLAA